MAKKVYKSITELVGNTPLVELTNYEKKLNLKAKIFAKLEYFNPESSVKDTIVTGIHNFTDVVKERVPEVLNREYIDQVVTIEPAKAVETTRLLAKTDGILIGVSSGAALSVATDFAKKDENAGKTIVVILPDTGLRYLSTNLFSE